MNLLLNCGGCICRFAVILERGKLNFDMPKKNENFFSPDPCQDPDYEAVRDLPQAKDYKCFVEELWREYEPYNNDPNFLSDARNHFHQRFWEMYLCVTMLKRGFDVEKGGKKGPEFSITIGGKRIWFEAIAPQAGLGADQVPEIEIGECNDVPTEQVLLRYTSALSEKLRKYQVDCAKGIISENDVYVVAINSNKIPNAQFGSALPYHVQAFLPFGYPTVVINPKTQEKVDEYFQYRDEVKKINGESISTKAFLDPAYSGISAVIHATLNVAGYTDGTTGWGDSFDVLHNPMATNPLPFEVLNWCNYRYIHDGKLETVTRTPHEHVDNPIKNWKNLLKDPEFVKDPRGWAQREALKAFDELRSAKEVD
jgi:hypothetical protein